MAVEGIKISFDEVTQTATSIRTLNTKMTTLLEDAKKEIDNLQSTYQSDSGETIRTKIATQSASFEEYRKVVDAYAQFLDDTIATYQTTENKINANAQQFL
ncbi:MAG: pore-forming ESAT-6 family protein [Clostridium sp.]|nr:pore-forming ESAT-6 family protein [Clostridium sp.]